MVFSNGVSGVCHCSLSTNAPLLTECTIASGHMKRLLPIHSYISVPWNDIYINKALLAAYDVIACVPHRIICKGFVNFYLFGYFQWSFMFASRCLLENPHMGLDHGGRSY